MYIKYNPNPCGRNVGDCAVRAISAALNIDWETAFDLICDAAKKMCDMPAVEWLWLWLQLTGGDIYGSRVSCQCYPGSSVE